MGFSRNRLIQRAVRRKYVKECLQEPQGTKKGRTGKGGGWPAICLKSGLSHSTGHSRAEMALQSCGRLRQEVLVFVPQH